ncbi:MAG TPA: FHA domain-containing protein [Solirubrobacterales bacterium]|nr:FHA domain-containing protein [Solirubrobacterales bacterium]
MNDLEPLAVALKFGFLAVLYLFLLWVTRMALRDLRGTPSPGFETGYHEVAGGVEPAGTDAFLVVQRGGGLNEGEHFDLFGGVSLGRSADADIRLDDRYASGVHARVFNRSGAYFVEDMNSTNGTLLNSRELHGEAELTPGDVIRIGDTEFRFEVS